MKKTEKNMEDNSQWTPIVVEQQEELRAQLARCQERLAMAEGLLSKVFLVEGCGNGFIFPIGNCKCETCTLAKEVEKFLTHTSGEYVAVRREDLQEIIHITERKAKLYFIGTKAIDRLKAALEGK